MLPRSVAICSVVLMLARNVGSVGYVYNRSTIQMDNGHNVRVSLASMVPNTQ